MNTALHELFVDELRDVYDAEQQLAKNLPKLAEAASSDELREAFENHKVETEGHISRLEKVFAALEEQPKRKKCKGIAGLIDEGRQVMKEHKDSASLDAALIAAGQKTEHYEIASYGCLCTWAELMGHEDALELLQENLAEEKQADEKLTRIAESVANVKAEETEEEA